MPGPMGKKVRTKRLRPAVDQINATGEACFNALRRLMAGEHAVTPFVHHVTPGEAAAGVLQRELERRGIAPTAVRHAMRRKHRGVLEGVAV